MSSIIADVFKVDLLPRIPPDKSMKADGSFTQLAQKNYNHLKQVENGLNLSSTLLYVELRIRISRCQHCIEDIEEKSRVSIARVATETG